MIILNKPGEAIVSSHKIVGAIYNGTLEIGTEHGRIIFRKGESINPRILVMSIQGERVINLQFVPAADSVKSVYMPDYATAEKFLTFVEHFINH